MIHYIIEILILIGVAILVFRKPVVGSGNNDQLLNDVSDSIDASITSARKIIP